jgi:recombination protein RecR
VSASTPAITAQPVSRLIDEFAKLPGIGPKTASRLAFFLLRGSREEATALAEAILDVKEKIRLCSNCFNITESDPCALCADPGRTGAICVVEEPLDVVALERTGQFKGRYHVLHGAISPIEGVTPEKLKIRELIERVVREHPEEVIIATNLDLPGDATATYIHRKLVEHGVTVSRPATGLPAGGDLEYADEVTLGRALAGRRIL